MTNTQNLMISTRAVVQVIIMKMQKIKIMSMLAVLRQKYKRKTWHKIYKKMTIITSITKSQKNPSYP